MILAIDSDSVNWQIAPMLKLEQSRICQTCASDENVLGNSFLTLCIRYKCFSISVPVSVQEQARKTHDQRQFVKICDKAISDSMESLLAVCFLTMTPPRVARLLHLYCLSNEPNPLSQLKPSSLLHSGDEYPSWVPLILESSYRAIDPEFSTDDWESMSIRQAEVSRILLANIPKTKAAAAAAAIVGTSSSDLNLEVLDRVGREGVGGDDDFYTILEKRRPSLAPLEDIIGYRFRRSRILLQAITHPSSELAFRWGCYQRLEFLGDAILDFVVTQRIFRDQPNMDPGEVTDLKISLVSNVNLAVICIRKGIYKFLEHMDNNLWVFIKNFQNAVSQNSSNIWELEVCVDCSCISQISLIKESEG